MFEVAFQCQEGGFLPDQDTKDIKYSSLLVLWVMLQTTAGEVMLLNNDKKPPWSCCHFSEQGNIVAMCFIADYTT